MKGLTKITKGSNTSTLLKNIVDKLLKVMMIPCVSDDKCGGSSIYEFGNGDDHRPDHN